jgi:pimeloyl-ACP methyl ester carboxylesterase
LDDRLTPHQGLRRWDGRQLVPDKAPALSGKTLLLVHGTFSNSDMFLAQWHLTPEGQQLWKDLCTRYKNVLVFDHPTLSVAPWINALDMHAATRNVAGTIDVLSHSRGGLVVSWWLRLAPSRVAKVIFVGSPLDGTSLASPYRLRTALDHLATIADLLAAGGEALATVAPIAAGAAGLAKIFGRVLKLGSSLPLVDAAVAMVPGLASQQRTNNNAETRCLFADKWLTTPAFAAVAANFEPTTNAPLWHVWERLKNAGAKVVAAGADMVFDGPNDLVVDTAAMRFLGPHHAVQPADLLDLGSGNTYHTSYFQDRRVTAFLDQRLR